MKNYKRIKILFAILVFVIPPTLFVGNTDYKQMSDPLIVEPRPAKRWPTNEATIMVNNHDTRFREAMFDAIDAWNSTGVFHFTVVEKPKIPIFQSTNADIVSVDWNEDDTIAVGLTETVFNSETGELRSATVKLNKHYLGPDSEYTHSDIVSVATHELGHAIGLHHTDERSVMQARMTNISIQEFDRQSVLDLYE